MSSAADRGATLRELASALPVDLLAWERDNADAVHAQLVAAWLGSQHYSSMTALAYSVHGIAKLEDALSRLRRAAELMTSHANKL